MVRDNNQGFRGLLALLIVFAHVSHEYSFPLSSEGSPYGMVVVGLFFFFSGYGLMKQYISRGTSYVDGFLVKRATKLLPSFVLILVIAVTLYLVTDIRTLEIAGGKIGYILIPNSWYVYVLFYYYILFVISCKFIVKPKKITFTLLISTFLLIVITTICGLGDWWWKSSFCFNVGTMMPLIENRYGRNTALKSEKTIIVLLFITLTVCLLPSIFEFGFYKVRALLLIIVTTILPIFLYMAFRKIEYKNHKIQHFLGSISYEIYLLHGVVLTVILNVIPDTNPLICIATIYIVTIILSYPISKASDLSWIKQITNG